MKQNNEGIDVICRSCGYSGPIHTYHPTESAYSDIRCPKCSSTNNEHNREYLRRLSEAIRGSREDDSHDV